MLTSIYSIVDYVILIYIFIFFFSVNTHRIFPFLKMFKFNSSHKHTTSSQTDKDLKEEGNRLFSYKQYEKAIECYNKAIVSEHKCFSLF